MVSTPTTEHTDEQSIASLELSVLWQENCPLWSGFLIYKASVLSDKVFGNVCLNGYSSQCYFLQTF